MALSLTEYDELIGARLRSIDAAAEICLRNAKELCGVPEFELLAADQLVQAERMMALALDKIIQARRIIGRLPHVH